MKQTIYALNDTLIDYRALDGSILGDSAIRFLRGLGTQYERRHDALDIYDSLTPEQKRRLD